MYLSTVALYTSNVHFQQNFYMQWAKGSRLLIIRQLSQRCLRGTLDSAGEVLSTTLLYLSLGHRVYESVITTIYYRWLSLITHLTSYRCQI